MRNVVWRHRLYSSQLARPVQEMKGFVWAFCCAKKCGKGSTVTFEGDLVKEPSGVRTIDFWTEMLGPCFPLPSEALNVECQEAGGIVVVPITGPLPHGALQSTSPGNYDSRVFPSSEPWEYRICWRWFRANSHVTIVIWTMSRLLSKQALSSTPPPPSLHPEGRFQLSS